MYDPPASAAAQMADRGAKDDPRPEEMASRQETIEQLRRLLADKEKELEQTKLDFAVTMRNLLALQRTRYEAEIRELREGRRARVGLLRPRRRG